MRIERMGDRAALLLDLEREPWRLAREIEALALPELEEAVPCYDSVGVYFREALDPSVLESLRNLPESEQAPEIRFHQVAIRYDGPDLDASAKALGLTPSDVARLHQKAEYTVMAIGFSPGFPYLGPLPEQLQGLPRLDQPRPRVPIGSVGITGSQTGIYPSSTPGGWNLIGTALEPIVDLDRSWFRFQVGDRVRFVEVAD